MISTRLKNKSTQEFMFNLNYITNSNKQSQ